MGGAGSGRKPKKHVVPLEDKIARGVEAATKAAKTIPPKAQRDAEKAKIAAKAKKEETKKASRKQYPKPDQFKGHPFADALNGFADKMAGLEGSKAAAQCQLGESWMAVVDYYLPAIDHPLAIALGASATYAVVAYQIRAQVKAKPVGKGPGSPSGPRPPGQIVIDAQCVHCGETFPDLPQVADHIREKHPEGKA